MFGIHKRLNKLDTNLQLIAQSAQSMQKALEKHMETEEKLYNAQTEKIEKLNDAIAANRRHYDSKVSELEKDITKQIDKKINAELDKYKFGFALVRWAWLALGAVIGAVLWFLDKFKYTGGGS